MQMVVCRSRDSWECGVRLRALAVFTLVSIVPVSLFAQSVSGTTSGKQSAFVRYTNILVLPSSGTVGVGSVTLDKGKKKRHLVADVTVSYSNPSELTHPLFSLEVNGIAVPPFSWLFTCPPTTQCLNSMTWWVDLDDLEEQNLGQIVSQPLNVELRLGSEVPFPSTASAIIIQMGARLQAK